MSVERYAGQELGFTECEVRVSNPDNGVCGGLKGPVPKNKSH